eukprot:gnl/TRDRNA2_/TRDRNA2_178659_c0_seq1.p1 gnl/TRDRNA2_/TRDRNA2_178659_c0~~gnl/TRDRNA2_/TRDRNA2_178659_c0_seq1.p1  ORF type:complete len:409 (+),score=71.08 gnl/TRDRNA2_/TRDRNA2_178659_c0_seq1:115-1341(+)
MKELIALGGCMVVASAIFAAMGFRGRDQVVGIDLGTTYSVVAIRSNDKVTVIPDYQTGKLLVPSVVSYRPNGSLLVGDSAVAMRSTDPLDTIFNAKRFIGLNFSEVKNDTATHPFRVTPNRTDMDSAAGFSVNGSQWVSPIDVGAAIVERIKRSVREWRGYPMSRAIICVPAKFSWRQTKATREAFEQAGFKVMRVLEEPVAAAVAYNLHRGSGVRHVLVYDIGGGTLDVSLLYMNGPSVSVSGVAGDDHLGGADFDEAMSQILKEKLDLADKEPSTRPKPGSKLLPCAREGLLQLAEKVKCDLSTKQTVEVQCLASDGSARDLAVTREEFEKGSADLFARALRPVEKALADQVMTAEHIDDIVLVGGASRMPMLRTMLQNYFGPRRPLHTEIDPDVTVAFGAANIVD